MQTGQTDATEDGGGNFTNRFAIDKNKAYEFTTYIQVTELDKHRVYFGFDGSASVIDAISGVENGNPYFAYPYPDANSGLKAGTLVQDSRLYHASGFRQSRELERSRRHLRCGVG